MAITGSRLHSLHPKISIDELIDRKEPVEDRRVLHDLQSVVRNWAQKNKNRLPDFFYEEVNVIDAERQVVSSVVLDIQNVRRNLESFRVPYDNNEIVASRWITSDLFQLVPFEKHCLFPGETHQETAPVAGQEELIGCDKCEGAAHFECPECSGIGQVSCPSCTGAGGSTCNTCNGAGSHLSGGTDLVECQSCNGSGIEKCHLCGQGSLVDCNNCNNGTVGCVRCNETGTLIKRWRVRTSITTVQHHWLYCKTGWVEPDDLFGVDGECLDTVQWQDPIQSVDRSLLKTSLSQHLYPVANDLVKENIRNPSDAERDSGLRIRTLASYLYRVRLDHNGAAGAVLIGGLSNRLVPLTLPKRSQTIGRKILRSIVSVFSLVGLGLESKLQRKYQQHVENGEAHLLDKNLLGPRMRAHGAEIVVTSLGYDITLSNANASVSIELETVSESNMLISASIPLGRASRELFPKALALNKYLDVGCIGLQEYHGRSVANFVLVDRRPYEFADAKNYLAVLSNLHREAFRVIEKGGLQ